MPWPASFATARWQGCSSRSTSAPARCRPLAAVDQLFPPRSGSAVVGPTFQLSWLEVAGAGFASVDLAVLVQVPGPVIALVGSFRAGIPGLAALLRLRADILG